VQSISTATCVAAPVRKLDRAKSASVILTTRRDLPQRRKPPRRRHSGDRLLKKDKPDGAYSHKA
jgi:hypothetical protein